MRRVMGGCWCMVWDVGRDGRVPCGGSYEGWDTVGDFRGWRAGALMRFCLSWNDEVRWAG